MALRDRQISGLPLPWGPAMFLSVCTILAVPVIGYNGWYALWHAPEELWPFLALIGMGFQIHHQTGRVPVGLVRAQQFFGRPTGIEYSASIYMLPKLPFPLLTLFLNVALQRDVYEYIFWTLSGDVSIRSIVESFFAEGLTRDGLRVGVKGKLRIEVASAAVFLVQDGKTVVDGVIAEYEAGVKSSVISQHTAEELMQGYHSGGSSALTEWMTHAWRLVTTYGVQLESVMIGEVKVLSKRMEGVLDAVLGKELLRSNTQEVALAFAQFKETLPAGIDDYVAFMLFNEARMDEGLEPVNMNIFKFK